MPEIGKTYRLKMTVEGVNTSPGAPTPRVDLVAGLIGTVVAIVKAAEDGAGDHSNDCAVIHFENGRAWSHPIAPVKAAITLAHGGAHEPHPAAPTLSFDDLFEEV